MRPCRASSLGRFIQVHHPKENVARGIKTFTQRRDPHGDRVIGPLDAVFGKVQVGLFGEGKVN